ncbi:hypothetical protein CLG96_03095 [Sphingomonas oleivorans]|uniref:Uncharacterized protein n=1 Tax=Sphingomonas oleivorans TaxID=1735121 RepID=A0A2T5G1Z1_9SPHN|nr:hypothetical protein [Sphingomonas oleivorans]PTQ13131.1 hypothetical protein CLG96_03095 [Sphingomonas oleivorans]
MRSLILSLLFATTAAGGQPASAPPRGYVPPEPLPIARLEAREVRRFSAPEARQGVAVDARFFYAIVNSRIGKYDKQTGKKLAEWIGDRRRITHLNSCVAAEARLICANSNFPQVPMASSVEIFDTATMRHIQSVPLGMRLGSLTWVERKDGVWWAGFANYDEKGGEPGHDHRFTMVAKSDDGWRQIGGYRFPDTVLQVFAPLSNSGGSWGDDGLLYVTGHDASEIYVLREPGEGPVLEHVATIAAPLEGQAWAWDRSAGRALYGITRRDGEVVMMTIPPVPLPARPAE